MKINTAWMISIWLLSVSAHAADKGLNGGDMCEDRFKIVRDDIAVWIGNGGASGLAFPQGLSQDQYNSGMLSQILKAQISCTDDKIIVGNVEKTCKNLVDSAGASVIVCNTDRFMSGTAESDQYILVHHEYAGLAGFETNGDSADSHYDLSNQITEYLGEQVVKKLSVKKQPQVLSCGALDTRTSPVGLKCMTTDGSVYERVSVSGFGMGWKAPNGLVWSGRLAFRVDYNTAADLCDQLGGEIPSRNDFMLGQVHGLREVLQETKYFNQWTSTTCGDEASYMTGTDGGPDVECEYRSNQSASVRCIKR
jgi:hypothetical protein